MNPSSNLEPVQVVAWVLRRQIRSQLYLIHLCQLHGCKGRRQVSLHESTRRLPDAWTLDPGPCTRSLPDVLPIPEALSIASLLAP